MISIFQNNYSEHSENDISSVQPANDSRELTDLSYIDKPFNAYGGLANLSADIQGLQKSQLLVSFVANDAESPLYLNDIAPFMLLSKMAKRNECNVNYDLSRHASLHKVLCSLNLTNSKRTCCCSCPRHVDVYPIPVAWYNPNDWNHLTEDDENKECQAFINGMSAQFRKQIKQFDAKYDLGETHLDELRELCKFLEEIMGNGEHARCPDNISFGEFGFACYMALRNGKLVINMSIISFGRTFGRTLEKKNVDVSMLNSSDSVTPNAQDALSIYGVIEDGLTSRDTNRPGGLHKFFNAAEAMSSRFEAILISGTGGLLRRPDVADQVFLVEIDTPGTILSTRFEIDLEVTNE